MTKDGEALARIVSEIINFRKEAVSISPAWIATEAMAKLDSSINTQTHAPLIYVGCHLYLRQIARAQCRGMFEADDPKPEAQHQLFPDLQWRYPIARTVPGEEPVYVQLERLTETDVIYNVNRLRNEANAKLKHADALDFWHRQRRAA